MNLSTTTTRHLTGLFGVVCALGVAVCLTACGAVVPEPVGDGQTETVPVEETTPEEQVETPSQTAPVTTPTNSSNAQADPEAAKQALDFELTQFANGDVDEIDTPTIDQLDDQDLLTPAVVSAWLSGFNFSLGEATSTSTYTATVDATITCRKIGAAYNSGSLTANQLAEALSTLQPETTTVSVEMMLDDDGEWEPSMTGYTALNDALVGPLAR